MTWLEIWQVTYKTIICYFFLIFILKIMGKREIGTVSTFDIVVFFVISELFSLSLNEPSGSIFHSLIPITIIVILQLLTAFISLKNHKIRSLVEGDITFIIYQGKINQKEMLKQRYNIDDLLSQLRIKDVQLPEEVQFAILEDSGTLTIIKKDECILKDPQPLISDGKIMTKVLKRVGINEEEVMQLLRNEGYFDYHDIFIALLKTDGALFCLAKEKH